MPGETQAGAGQAGAGQAGQTGARGWCRSGCGAAVVVEAAGGAIRAIRPDAESPLGEAAAGCDHGLHAQRSDRILRARRRVGEGAGARWEELDTARAIREVGGEIARLRRESGSASLAILAGRSVGGDAYGALRTAGAALALGTPNLYSALADHGGPWLQAAGAVIGRESPLQCDVGRAHYVLSLGGDPARGWGPLQRGQGLAAALAHSRKTKSTKVVAVEARRSGLTADLHLQIRPGTEVFFVLGMIRATLDNRWQDAQFVRDYARGMAELEAALAPWPLERCAAACGLAPGDIQGIALKFARAAMAVCWRGAGALSGPHAGLTAWALLALHGITANLLRPGGLYEPPPPCDLTDLRQQIPPGVARSGHPTLLLQAPAAAICADLHRPGEGQPRALLSLYADPYRELPGGEALRRGLDGLDLLVAVDARETETTRRARYVLPAAHAWERADLRLFEGATLPVRHAAAAPAILPPPGGALPLEELLRDLARAAGPSLRSPLPLRLRLMAGRLASIDLHAWARRYWERNSAIPWDSFQGKPAEGGDLDRAHGTPSHPDGRMDLAPAACLAALRELQEPVRPADLPLLLLASAARDPMLPGERPAVDPGVSLHPRHGFVTGQRVRIRTAGGAVEATVRLDPGLHPEAVDLPAGYAADVMSLIPGDALDPLSGAAILDGLPCRVEAA